MTAPRVLPRGVGRLLRFAGRLWLTVALIAVWELVTRAADEAYFPPPSTIATTTYELWFSGPVTHLFLTTEAIDDFTPSLAHVFGGWALASVAGIALGVAIGRSQIASDVLDPVLQFGRAVPPPTLIPFFIVVFQLGTSMQVATIIFGIVWPVLLNTIDGVRTVEPLHLDTARVFRITGAFRLVRVILPAAAPKIFAGLRVSLALALILMVISELIGSSIGIGAHLLNAQRSFELPQMWAGIATLGILGYLFNAAFLLVERRFLAWHSGARRTEA